MLESIFRRAVEATGDAYVMLRELLVGQGDSAAALLLQLASKESATEARWLAEILYHRVAKVASLQDLEHQFHERVFLLISRYPNRAIKPMGLHYSMALGLPGEFAHDEDLRDKLEKIWDADAPAVLEFYQRLEVPDSQYWSSLLGETLSKGWVPSSECVDPDFTPDYPNTPAPGPTSEDHVVQAIALLGKLGEQRAGPPLLRILEDRRVSTFQRAVSAVALGRLQYPDATRTLLSYCQSGDVPRDLQYAAFDSVALMADKNAISILQEIADNPQPTIMTEAFPTVRAKSRASAARNAIRHLELGSRPF